MTRTCTLLWELGIRATYKGYRQAAVGVISVMKEEDSLLSVTKLLYPAIAKEFHTTPTSVERNLRTVVAVCWERGNRDLLQKIAGYPLMCKPTVKEFIEILASYQKRQENGLG